MSSPGPDSYSIQVPQAVRIIEVSRSEGEELDRRAATVAAAIDAATAASGPGSPVTGALAGLRARHDEVARGNHDRVERATTAASTAVGAYVAADGHMAEQYGPYAVPPGHPVVPADLGSLLDQNGFPPLPPR
jgi:hypothetical protein